MKDKTILDYVALEDKLRRSELMPEAEFKIFRQMMYKISFIRGQTRRKIKRDHFEELMEFMKKGEYYFQLKEWYDKNLYSFNF